jgi:hypothetical protein
MFFLQLIKGLSFVRNLDLSRSSSSRDSLRNKGSGASSSITVVLLNVLRKNNFGEIVKSPKWKNGEYIVSENE